MMENLRELYQEVILDHNKNPRNFRKMEDPDGFAHGNNPLCGREVIFRLEIIMVRDATDEEIEYGGKVVEGPDLNGVTPVPIN